MFLKSVRIETWIWAGWTDGHGAAGLTRIVYECVRMNKLHRTYHVFCIFICLTF